MSDPKPLPSNPSVASSPTATPISRLAPVTQQLRELGQAAGNSASGRRKTVVVASYDLDLALRLKHAFSAKNLRTVICSSFNEMLRLVNETDMAVLILDFSIESVKEGLPEVDNMYALRETRKLPRGARLPVICAAAVESTQMVSCLIQGYSAFLKRSHLEEQMWKYVDQFLEFGKLDLNRPL
ncbi:MAG: hypothetical protein ACREJ2_05355 [Planctomycetota bacterium]